MTAYLEAENAYTDAVMKPTEALQDTLYKEMLGRIKQTDLAVPVRERRLLVLHAHRGGASSTRSTAARRAALDAPEEVLLDVNELAKGEKFLAIGAHAASATTATCSPTRPTPPASASTRCTSRTCAPASCWRAGRRRSPSVDWAADNKTLFYVTEDARQAARTSSIGTRSASDGRRRAGLRGEGRALPPRRRPVATARLPVPRDRQPDDHRECATSAADEPAGEWQIVAPREDRPRVRRRPPRRHVLHPHQQGRPQLPLVTAPVERPVAGELEGPRPAPRRRDAATRLSLFEDHCVVVERERRAAAAARRRLRDAAQRADRMRVPGAGVRGVPGAATRSSTRRRSASRYQSLVDARSRCSTTTWQPRHATLLKRDRGARRLRPAELHVGARLTATAADGTKVPISLVYQKDAVTRRHGTRCCSRLRLLRHPDADVAFSLDPLSACSTAAWSTRSPTSAAAATSASTGTTTAAC